jgi:hypothetical protein
VSAPTGADRLPDKAVIVGEKRRGGEPVFVDRTGRRRRVIAFAGSIGGLLVTVAVLALVAGFTGVGPASVPGWPESAAGDVRGVRTTPEPSGTRRSADPRPQAAERTAEPTPTGSPAGVIPETTPTPAPSTTEASPTPSAVPTTTTIKGHGHKPTHTPGPRASRTK